MRASSDLAGQVERSNPKLLSRGEDRSSLKYIINVLLLNSKYFFERKFGLSTRVCVSVLGGSKLLSNTWYQKCQKVLPCRHFVSLLPLEFGH